MPRKTIPLPEWIPQACELMVRYDLSLREAASELGIDITSEESESIKSRKLFKALLEEKRLARYAEIGSDPNLNQHVVIGMLFKMAERLAADREDYKAADALLKLAKVKGIVGTESDSLSTIFARLSQADIDSIKERLKRKVDEESNSSQSNGADPLERSVN